MAKRPEKMLGFADSGSVESLPEDCSPLVGESQPIAKGLNNWNILAIGYNTSSTWIGLAVSMTVAIASGGSVTLLYGVIIVNIAMFFTGLTLAELASVYPTAGGQYHFTALLAPSNWGRSMSYICGVATAFAWMAQAANMCLFTAQILLAIVMHWQPEYEPRAWHYFLIYEAANVAMIIYNIFLTGRTMFLGNIGGRFWLILPFLANAALILYQLFSLSAATLSLPYFVPSERRRLPPPLRYGPVLSIPLAVGLMGSSS